MLRITFLELIEALNKEKDNGSTDYLLEECKYIDSSNIKYETKQKSKIVDQRRWCTRKESVFKIDEYYLAVSWDDPATEEQEGQDTNCSIYEVFPKEKTIVEYVSGESNGII